MSYEITGKLTVVYPIIQRTEAFKTREFVIEKTEDIGGRIITNFAKFQCVQDKTTILDRFNIGDDVKVMFNIKGTKWVKDGRETYITNLDAWRIETVKLSNNNEASTNINIVEPNLDSMPPAMENIDDLPF